MTLPISAVLSGLAGALDITEGPSARAPRAHVRLGHFKGSTVGSTGFRKGLALLMAAVPRKKSP